MCFIIVRRDKSTMLWGTCFILVESIQRKLRSYLFYIKLQCLDEHIFPNYLLHIYMCS